MRRSRYHNRAQLVLELERRIPPAAGGAKHEGTGRGPGRSSAGGSGAEDATRREAWMNPKITPDHLARAAVVYVRQSTMAQVTGNLESQRRQYDLGGSGRSDGLCIGDGDRRRPCVQRARRIPPAITNQSARKFVMLNAAIRRNITVMVQLKMVIADLIADSPWSPLAGTKWCVSGAPPSTTCSTSSAPTAAAIYRPASGADTSATCPGSQYARAGRRRRIDPTFSLAVSITPLVPIRLAQPHTTSCRWSGRAGRRGRAAIGTRPSACVGD